MSVAISVRGGHHGFYGNQANENTSAFCALRTTRCHITLKNAKKNIDFVTTCFLQVITSRLSSRYSVLQGASHFFEKTGIFPTKKWLKKRQNNNNKNNDKLKKTKKERKKEKEGKKKVEEGVIHVLSFVASHPPPPSG